jgi:hypothetical protein
MSQNNFERVVRLIICLAGVSQPLRPQVSSGGVVASPSAVIDFTNAGQTVPARKQASDPSACTVGEQYFNTTSNVLKICTAANTWTTAGSGGAGVSSVGLSAPNNIFTISGSPVTSSGTLTLTPSGTSGGIPYFSGAAALASSSALGANGVVVGGGAGAAPKTTGVTIDSSNNISTPGTISTGSSGSAHGKLALQELPANGAATFGFEAPDLLSASLSLQAPNAIPAANSFMLIPAPTAGISQWQWGAFSSEFAVTSSVVGRTVGTAGNLPACSGSSEGMLRAVTDSNTNTWGAVVAGGGTNHVLAYCDGTSWTVAAK